MVGVLACFGWCITLLVSSSIALLGTVLVGIVATVKLCQGYVVVWMVSEAMAVRKEMMD